MAGQKNVCGRKEPGSRNCRADRNHSPDLIWLSLVGMLPSRAQLRFARQGKHSLWKPTLGEKFKTGQTRPPGRGWLRAGKPLANREQTVENGVKQFAPSLNRQSVHLPVLTRPTVAGFNAPNDNHH